MIKVTVQTSIYFCHVFFSTFTSFFFFQFYIFVLRCSLPNHSLTHSLTSSSIRVPRTRHGHHCSNEDATAISSAAGGHHRGWRHLPILAALPQGRRGTHSLPHSLTHYLPPSPSIHCIMHLRTCCLTWPTTW